MVIVFIGTGFHFIIELIKISFVSMKQTTKSQQAFLGIGQAILLQANFIGMQGVIIIVLSDVSRAVLIKDENQTTYLFGRKI